MDVIQYKRIKGDFSVLVEYDVILDAGAVTVFYKNIRMYCCLIFSLQPSQVKPLIRYNKGVKPLFLFEE